MASEKIYKISINGLTESINAVDSLNKQLDTLEKRINAVNATKVSAPSGGGGGRSSNASALSAEEAAQREINKLKAEGERLDAKIAATQDEIYKRVDATKQLYKETVEDQKAIAAQERLVADSYSNTMAGMKAKLADIKAVINTTDLGDTDKIKQMTKDANDLNNKLKEMEQEYGQYGRNVGNYANGVAEGLQKVRITVGDTVREFSNAREASRTLNNELKTMALNGQQDTEAFKQLQQVVMEMESNINDVKKPMDNLMDSMESIIAISQTTKGLSAFFGFDNSEIDRSIQKLVGLQNAMQGIQKIQKQIQTREGIGKIFMIGSQGIDRFIARITRAKIGVDGLTMSSRAATLAVRGLSLALKTIGVGVLVYGITVLVDAISKLGESMNTSEKSAHKLDKALKSLNDTYDTRRDMMTSLYLSGGLSDEEFLTRQYDLQTTYISKQIALLRERMSIMNEQSGLMSQLGFHFDDSTSTYKGGRMQGDVTVESFNTLTSFDTSVLRITVKDIKEVEEAWRKCNEAIKEGKDYLSKWGEGVVDWFGSLVATVEDTERVMTELGEVKVGDFVARFDEINNRFNKGEISAEQFAGELKKLKNELNNNDVLRSVIVNLDKYIPDEGVREAVQNIINEIVRLDDSFNMTSPEQIRHWMQVRIDGMKEGTAKIKAQIDADEKYEIAQYGKTQEQIDLIRAKYARKREEELKRYGEQQKNEAKQRGKQMASAEDELARLRIQNMEEGLEKEIAQLKQEMAERLRAVRENGIKVGELSAEIEKLYEKKILDATRKWAAETKKVYEYLYNNIQKFNTSTFNVEVSTATQNVKNRSRSQQSSTGYDMLTPTNYDDSKNLEEYYRKILDIKKKAAEKEYNIEQERLDKQLESNKKEEELRHNRLIDENGGEYIKQLRAGLITQEKYDKLVEDENDAHYARMNALDKQYASNLSAATEDSLEKTQKVYSDFYDNVINSLRRDKSKVDEVINRQPVTDTSGWGVVNIGKTSQNYTNALAEYDKIRQEILKKQSELEQDLKNHNISAEDFAIRQEDLKNELKAIDDACKGVKESQKRLIADFLQSMQQYIQAGMDSFNTIMQAVWEAQDNQFDKEADALDKLNETLDKKLDEQQEIVEKHKSAIDSIEDELATSRGDRRQHLIDQLNAEMAAQREAQKQEQKIQKEKEAAQKKQDALELKRKKAQYHRDMLQAIVNGAMAITYAAINSWPVPAIPMMALAGATTAAQIAVMSANKPFRVGGQLDGGLVKGKRHNADGSGGVPVGNTGIFVEGDEMIIRRESTMPNIDLLNYINKSRRKLSLDDFIDYYSSGSLKKTISAISPSRQFADGGQLPSLSTDIDINDRLISAMEAYANRPYYVTVTDIENRMNQVKYVRTLAGVGEK